VRLLLVHHLVDLPGWEGIATRQVDRLASSGLLDALEAAHFLLHYDARSFEPLQARLAGRKNVHFHFDPTVLPREAEVPSVAFVRDVAAAGTEEAAIAYVHMKGVTRPGDRPAEDWARFMEHVVIERWRDCVDRLEDGADTCGVNFRFRPYPMYAGNFWWTRASYARGLMPLCRQAEGGVAAQVPGQTWDARYDAEAWVLSGSGRHVSLDTSPVRDRPAFHYENPYPPEAYRGRPPVEFPFSTRDGRLTAASRMRWALVKRFRPVR
jgi:hypothetical protein